ncbi:hypothetical protein CVT24_005814 [Panaeolus cyanescens]|uniref:Fungal lipase-type domain-containing protein n=1 Tax=Panaeolus cyanescens TaxID=181874 RepID=A0A409V904_9AGAR|nr:hypothetical protein CVT24_005814 [Panaeolus cyanescens]
MPHHFAMLKLLLLAALGSLLVSASPIELIEKRQTTFTTLTSAQISAFKPYTHFASTAYCKPATTIGWSCGSNCNANPTFVPVASGGDGASVQFWYVGYDQNLKSVIVAHQGTDTSKIEALLTDANIVMKTLSTSLFPGISSSIKVHDGFADAHAKTAATILSSVKTALSRSGYTKVTLVGHSLGAALALLDSVYLPLNLKGVTYRMIGYGMPRVGNQNFADYVDANVDVTHINNKKDLVPILPGRFLGFHHPSGEKHIQASNAWIACPGQDNTDDRCTVGTVGNILEGNTSDHSGPYDGVTMGC